jgi:hypothetical protein
MDADKDCLVLYISHIPVDGGWDKFQARQAVMNYVIALWSKWHRKIIAPIRPMTTWTMAVPG